MKLPTLWRLRELVDALARHETRSGTTRTDADLAIWSHDPALAIHAVSDLSLLGQGHPANVTCKRIEGIRSARRTRLETWSNPRSFDTALAASSFGHCPSVKWSGRLPSSLPSSTLDGAPRAAAPGSRDGDGMRTHRMGDDEMVGAPVWLAGGRPSPSRGRLRRRHAWGTQAT